MTSYLSDGDRINRRINLQRSLTSMLLMRTSACNGNFSPQKRRTLASSLYLIVILNCLWCLLESAERAVKTLKLLNSLSHCSLSASNLISVSLRDENEIIFALSRMCDWHSLQFALFFFLMLHKVHKSSCFHLFILLLLFIVSLFLFFYWKWKCIWSYLLHTLPRFLPLHEVYVYSTFYAINTSDYTNNRRLSQFARSRI